MSEQIEGRNAVLEAFRSGKCVDKFLSWMVVRMDRYARSREKHAKKTRSLIMYRRKDWISSAKLEHTRE